MTSSSMAAGVLPNVKPCLLLSHHYRRPGTPSTAWVRTRTRTATPLHLLHKSNSNSPSISAVGGVASETSSREKLHLLASEFQTLPQPLDRVKRLLDYASRLPDLPEEEKTSGNRVTGCTAQVWVAAALDGDGRMRFGADSDSEITKGFCACLVGVLDGATPAEVMEVGSEDLAELNVVGLKGRVSSRTNTWHSVLVSMQKRTEALVAERGRRTKKTNPFPPIVIGKAGLRSIRSYTEAQSVLLSNP